MSPFKANGKDILTASSPGWEAGRIDEASCGSQEPSDKVWKKGQRLLMTTTALVPALWPGNEERYHRAPPSLLPDRSLAVTLRLGTIAAALKLVCYPEEDNILKSSGQKKVPLANLVWPWSGTWNQKRNDPGTAFPPLHWSSIAGCLTDSAMEVLPAIVAWAASSACRSSLVAESAFGHRFCARAAAVQEVADLAQRLSSAAQVLVPGDKAFDDASRRWNVFDEPRPAIVVIPGTASDVAETVKYANEHDTPFLAVGGRHGAASTLGKLQGGIEIALNSLSSVELSKDGQTARIGGGTLSGTVVDALWKAGKQTVTGTCECTSLVGPGLGGGHGWLQGRHGLIADQFVSMDVVLADGSARTVDAQSDPDLWWALRGAGHNFAIVTSVTLKVYDIQHRDWAREAMIFTGDKVEQVFQTMADTIFKGGKQDADVVVWTYMLRIPEVDAKNPLVVVYLLQEGVRTVDKAHSAALKELGPVSGDNTPGTYLDLAAWTLISMTDTPCQKTNASNLRFPLYLDTYDAGAVRRAYDLFAASLRGTPEFGSSIFLFENYPVQGLRQPAANDSAFAFRGDNILVAPLISFPSGDRQRGGEAVLLGEALRNTLHQASGRKTMHTYVNYAFRDGREEMYGAEAWRQQKLAKLKAAYDPHGRFNFYNPVV
ncbi:FAD binding domain [Cordyceps militaris]|uniref:FAD binding domain n=1 Tax=Cordyceps militaris TaxID=73501 RepID=A0A2H4SFD1_CORMI|nr:FAD binding domain [Cordyceps militaris]